MTGTYRLGGHPLNAEREAKHVPRLFAQFWISRG